MRDPRRVDWSWVGLRLPQFPVSAGCCEGRDRSRCARRGSRPGCARCVRPSGRGLGPASTASARVLCSLQVLAALNAVLPLAVDAVGLDIGDRGSPRLQAAQRGPVTPGERKTCEPGYHSGNRPLIRHERTLVLRLETHPAQDGVALLSLRLPRSDLFGGRPPGRPVLAGGGALAEASDDRGLAVAGAVPSLRPRWPSAGRPPRRRARPGPRRLGHVPARSGGRRSATDRLPLRHPPEGAQTANKVSTGCQQFRASSSRLTVHAVWAHKVTRDDR